MSNISPTIANRETAKRIKNKKFNLKENNMQTLIRIILALLVLAFLAALIHWSILNSNYTPLILSPMFLTIVVCLVVPNADQKISDLLNK